MRTLFANLSYALRTLGRRPGYSLTVVGTLALGIGAVVAVFTLLDRVLLRPLPYPDSERLVLVRQQNIQTDWNTSVVDFQAIASRSTLFEGVAAMQPADTIVSGIAQPESASARWVTAGFFEVMSVPPARGRGFQPGEDQPGAARVVVVSHAFAERQFGTRDPLGRNLTLDGEAYTVVGVMAPGTERLAGMRADLWPAMQLDVPERRGPFFLSTIARLKPGATLAEARDELDAISRHIFPEWQSGFQDETARLVPRLLREVIVGNTDGFLRVAFGAVLAVLLIALVNSVNLALIRVTERAQDLAVRATLGAGRGHLLRLLLTESLLLAALGGLAGLGLAAALLELYRSLGPELPRLAEATIDGRVAAFAAAVTLISAIVFAAVPLLFGPSGATTAAPSQSRGASADRGLQLVRNGLVTLEFAVALPLLVAAGLLVVTLLRLQQVDPGFAADHLLTARLRLLETKYPETADRLTFWERALPELQAMPGVTAAGLAGAVPPACGCYNNFDLVGRPAEQGSEPQSPWVPVTPGYFEASGVRLLDGRWFDAGDTPESPPVVLVSESWAKRYFPGESALGQRLYEGGDYSQAMTVVGVVGDVRFDGLKAPGEAVFAPISQGWPSSPAYLYLRTGPDPEALTETLRSTLTRLDSDLVPTEIATMEGVLRDSLRNERHWAVVIVGFALSALLLSALGVFGVLAYYVSRQYREIGIRLAMGADPRRVVGMVIRRGFGYAAAGTAIGIVLALFLTRGLESLLFQVERLEPVNLMGACALLLTIAFAACWLPARRAARVDPAATLRHE